MNGHDDHHPLPDPVDAPVADVAGGAMPQAASRAPRRPCPAASPPAREWVIALDPATGRFRVDIPHEATGADHTEEKWLMVAIAACIDDQRFRERIVEAAFSEVVDRATSH